MKFLWRYMLLVAAFMAASLLVAACGGEEELDLDEYFQRVEEISNEAETRGKKLAEEYEGAGEEIEATRDFSDDAEDILRRTLNDLKGLNPPAEAQDAHDGYVAAVAGMQVLMEELRDQLADLESPSELKTLGTEFGETWEPASERAEDACLELQGIADENGIDVDLDCE